MREMPSALLPKDAQPRDCGNWLLPLGCAAYALAYAVLSVRRFAFFSAGIDLSYYIRIVYGLAHGQLDVPLVASPNLLGLHLEPILVPFALLYRLGFPIAPLLLVAQAIAVGLLPWPVFRVAKRLLHDRQAALCCAFGSLLYPTVTVATLHDFHPVTVALPFVAAFLDALHEGATPSARRRAWLFGLLALSCREDIALQLAFTLTAFAVAEQDRHRRKVQLLVAALLVAYFGVYILWIQPRYLSAVGSYSLHFGALGSAGPAGSVRSGRDLLFLLLQRPGFFLRSLATWERLRYVLELLWPLGFLPVLGWRFAVGALPVVAVNFLSAFPRVRSIESHYTTAMVPFLLIGAVAGLGACWGHGAAVRSLARVCTNRFLSRMVRGAVASRCCARPRVQTGLAIGLLLLCSHVLAGASPLALLGTRFSWSAFGFGLGATQKAQVAALAAAVARVPHGVSVAARPGALAHLADRRRSISPPEYDDGLPVDVVLTEDATPKGQLRIGGQTVR